MRTRQGMLVQAMPRLRERMAVAQASGIEHIIMESNSVMRLLRPELYLSVLDFGTADFKPSARDYLDRAERCCCIVKAASWCRSGECFGA